jgi:hypothetical protein
VSVRALLVEEKVLTPRMEACALAARSAAMVVGRYMMMRMDLSFRLWNSIGEI